MKIDIDPDFTLASFVIIIAIVLVIAYQTLVPRSSVDYWISENDILFSELSSANREVSILTHQLEKYHATEESLISLGASHTQAVAVIKAAEVYSLDPKH